MSVFLAFLGSKWKYILPLIVGLALGFGGAWKLQGMRLDSAKAKLAVVELAKAEQDNTIKALQGEVAKGNKSCQERLTSKDNAIKKLRKIDNLRGSNEKKPNSGDDILDALNRLFDDDKDAVR